MSPLSQYCQPHTGDVGPNAPQRMEPCGHHWILKYPRSHLIKVRAVTFYESLLLHVGQLDLNLRHTLISPKYLYAVDC